MLSSPLPYPPIAASATLSAHFTSNDFTVKMDFKRSSIRLVYDLQITEPVFSSRCLLRRDSSPFDRYSFTTAVAEPLLLNESTSLFSGLSMLNLDRPCFVHIAQHPCGNTFHDLTEVIFILQPFFLHRITDKGHLDKYAGHLCPDKHVERRPLNAVASYIPEFVFQFVYNFFMYRGVNAYLIISFLFL